MPAVCLRTDFCRQGNRSQGPCSLPMAYDNSSYWRGLHETHPGSLKAVGHPWLSETLNTLKYESEVDTLRAFLDAHRGLLTNEMQPRVADIGAGTGFWTELLERWFENQGRSPLFTLVDISRGPFHSSKNAILPSKPSAQTSRRSIRPF